MSMTGIRPFFAAFFHIIAKIAAVTADDCRVFVERFEQLQNFFELLRRELAPVREVFQLHFLRADLQQNVVQLRVVIHVFGAFLARDRVKRRLRDIDIAVA